MNLIDLNLLAEGGWDIGPNLLNFGMAVLTFLTVALGTYLSWKTKADAAESKIEARRARRVSVKAAVVVGEIRKEVAALPEIKIDVNSNFSKQEEARKLSDKRLETANEKLESMSKLLMDSKTEQAQADMARTMVQKVNGPKHAEPPPMPPANIVNVETMQVEADAVSVAQKEKKSD